MEQNNNCTSLFVFFFSSQFSKPGFQMGILTPRSKSNAPDLPNMIRVPNKRTRALYTHWERAVSIHCPRLRAPSGICTVCVGVPEWRHPPVIIVSTRPGAAVPPASVGRSGARCDGVGARAETKAAVWLLLAGRGLNVRGV